jgi:hypothetical protein
MQSRGVYRPPSLRDQCQRRLTHHTEGTGLDASRAHLGDQCVLLVLAVTIAAAGRFSTILGQKQIFLTSVVIFTFSSVTCGLANGGPCSSSHVPSRGSEQRT